MTVERIDIEVTDKVSPKSAKKLRDIAASALEADSAIDRLRASIASLNSGAVDRMATASSKLTAQQQRTAGATNQAKAATDRAKASSGQARAALTAEASASQRLTAAKHSEASAQNVAATAAERSVRVSRKATRASRLASHQTQNLIYQINDVVVGLGSGQRPMTVLLQQGSQFSTIFGPGHGVVGTLKLVAKGVWGILAPLAPVAIAVGVLAAGFGVLAYEIRKSTNAGDFTKLQGRVDGLKKSYREAITVGVTFGDVMKASMILVGESIYGFLKPAIDALSPVFVGAYNWILKQTKTFINSQVGYFMFAKDAIVIMWRRIGPAIGSAMVGVANSIVDSMETAINRSILLINLLIKQVNQIPGVAIAALNGIKLGRITDSFEKHGESLGTALANAAKKAATTDYAGQMFKAIKAKAIVVAQERINKSIQDAIDKGGKLNKKLTRKQEILRDIQAPLKNYQKDIKLINQLLAEGKIKQGQFNEAVASLSLVADLRKMDTELVGTPFADTAQIEVIRVAEQERLNIVQNALDARILSEQEAAARVVAINKKASAEIKAIEMARSSMIMQNARDTFASLAEVAKGVAGEQSAAYKALFNVSKAFAIADSIIKIQQGIANALSLPFPMNLAAAATVAAETANIVTNIQAVKFRDGGMVRGAGGPRDDAIVARVSNGEFVVNAAATARNRPQLEAINNGTQVNYQSAQRQTTRETISAGLVIHGGINVYVEQGEGAEGETDTEQATRIGRAVKEDIRALVQSEVFGMTQYGGMLSPRGA